ncbi:MAG: hypothetical protein NZ561_05765 [Phycisphaerae bacterium]|nr:hypothetical protein [Phycisphaerae bacterium]MDW8262776.1 hypothetical protein [Phycisphaerales bacterium]
MSALNRLPTLDYATSDADGTPDWHEEAERLIDAGRPLRRLNRCFRRGIDSARYFRKSAQRRYCVQTREAACVGCGRPNQDFVARVIWSIDVPTRPLELQIWSEQGSLPLETWHTLCPPCFGEWGRRVRHLLRLQSAGRVLLWLGIVFYLGWVLLERLLWGRSPGLWVSLGFLGLVVAIPIVAKLLDAWRVGVGPRALRRLMPRGVRLIGPAELYSIDELRQNPNLP